MNFNIEQLEKNKVEEGKNKLFFISTFGWPLVEVKKSLRTRKGELLRIVYESYF